MKLSSSLMVVFVVVLITGFNIWYNSREPEAFSEIHSGYGIKFGYPEGMSFYEDNFGSKPVSMESGFFQGLLSEDPLFIYIQVFWNTSDVYGSPVDFVDSFLERVEGSPDEVSARGSVQYSLKDGYSVVFRCFNVTDRGGNSYNGIIGSWRDDEVSRFYMVTYLTTEAVGVEGLTDLFDALVESVENN